LLLTLSREYASAETQDLSSYQLMGTMLRDADLQIGSNGLGAIVFSIGAVIIYYILYKTKLIPKWLSLWGLIGGVLYLGSPILNMFEIEAEFLMYLLAIQEMIMAVWLIVKGFNESAFNSLMLKQK
jgi:hypothetical protein